MAEKEVNNSITDILRRVEDLDRKKAEIAELAAELREAKYESKIMERCFLVTLVEQRSYAGLKVNWKAVRTLQRKMTEYDHLTDACSDIYGMEGRCASTK